MKQENALKDHQDDGDQRTEVRAQQVRYEEMMVNQQSSERQIKEMNDKNSRPERKIKRLEKEKELVEKFQRWEKKVGEMNEKKNWNKELVKTN